MVNSKNCSKVYTLSISQIRELIEYYRDVKVIRDDHIKGTIKVMQSKLQADKKK